jgi:hypothetical protein
MLTRGEDVPKKRKRAAPARLQDTAAAPKKKSAPSASGDANKKRKPSSSSQSQSQINSMFSKMDTVVPRLEIGRILQLPGGLFSNGKDKSKVPRMVEIIGHEDSKQLKDSCAEAYQFKDLDGEYNTDTLWVTAVEYQKHRHTWFMGNADKHAEYKNIITELRQLEEVVLHYARS